MDTIFCREEEKKELQKVFETNEAAFLAVFGRRRIGKTYLIKNFFRDKGLFFHVTGVQKGSTEVQLANFAQEFSDHFRKGEEIKTPKNWFSAFQLLRKELEKIPSTEKVILFFDELPWLVTRRSSLMEALEYLWNRYLCDMPNSILIVCGSAASWMIDNVINNKGGLHGRVTKQMRLIPFTLKETKSFLEAKNIFLDRKQIIELYMCLGGVAKYLTYIERGISVAEIIGKLCFSFNGPLVSEFHNLYRSLFQHHEHHIAIVRVLGKKRQGLTYRELCDATGIPTGGTFTKRLEELKQSGFIIEIPQFGLSNRENLYRLIDEFSLFHLSWSESVSALDIQSRGAEYWQAQRNSQSWKNWSGYAFETICLKHIEQIKAAIGISAVETKSSKWKSTSVKVTGKPGVEIDLVMDRKDDCINLFEMKFYNDVFTVDTAYREKLLYKKHCFEEMTKTKKATFMTLMTTYGVHHNEHFYAAVDKELTMETLFE